MLTVACLVMLAWMSLAARADAARKDELGVFVSGVGAGVWLMWLIAAVSS